MLTGVEQIAAERARQIQVEGWSAQHDDRHDHFELTRAANAYTLAVMATGEGLQRIPAPSFWPWHAAWWKPSDDPIPNLIKAGALIAAEIDRLQRLRALLTSDTQQETI